jgi:hypothetical protein
VGARDLVIHATTSDHDATLQVPSVSRVTANPQAPGGCGKSTGTKFLVYLGGNIIECGGTFCFFRNPWQINFIILSHEKVSKFFNSPLVY